MQTETEEVNSNARATQSEIEAKIAELKARYARLERSCSFGARISPATVECYAREIESLQAQLN